MSNPIVDDFSPPDTIRIATINDLAWILHLQELHRHELGRLHAAAITDKIERQKLLLILENGDPAGYVNSTTRRDHHLHILQIAITEELWRTGHASRAIQYLATRARKRGALYITCRTATDLPANRFWPTLGFKQHGTIKGPQRVLNKWAWRLSPIIIPGVRLQFPRLRRKGSRPRATNHPQRDPLGQLYPKPQP